MSSTRDRFWSLFYFVALEKASSPQFSQLA